MSDLTQALAGPVWFASVLAITHYVSTEAGLAVTMLSLIAALVWAVPRYYIRPL